MKKCKCGKDAEWDFGDETYCQECWEAECDKSWWEGVSKNWGCPPPGELIK